MDRFIVRKGDYNKLLDWRDSAVDGTPIPFKSCVFLFQDTGLQAETNIQDDALTIRFAKEDELGMATVPLPNGARWMSNQTFSFEGVVAPDCIAEFLRFYRTLSVFMREQQVIYKTSLREFIEKDLGGKVEETSLSTNELDEKIISLTPVKVVTLYQEAEDHIAHTPTTQRNPCQYAFWVRGHNRKYRTGLVTWVRPYKRNTQYEERDKCYMIGGESYGVLSLEHRTGE